MSPVSGSSHVATFDQSFWVRDVASTLQPSPTQRTTLIVAGVYIIVIAILWHVPILNKISEHRVISCWLILLAQYTPSSEIIAGPLSQEASHTSISRLLTVGFHEMSHAIMGLLTCAKIHSIELDPDEGGATSMSGGIPWLTLPAGYLGSSFIGACLIACGFDTNASKVAVIVIGVFFLFTLWWARRNWLTWVLILSMAGLIILFWFVAESVALRFLVLFIGVMSCLYCIWDIIDDTIARKVNSSDASAFAKICGCCPSQVWGVIWLIQAFIFFIAGILVGLAAFKQSTAQQKEDSSHFLPAPGSTSAAFELSPDVFLMTLFALLISALGL
ncbi:hypothetical protein MIND_01066800 [Mycena indigotica]|uniref:Peptidase M50B-like-domain-containing protein n=1 Tax=Mycena indigotica TaxID=2126181 RepID=A0A8H6VVD3_9AGAR|nr:uncharacterized protein MIND_01066800 [Mycena indigotica]KAF7295277.1 hypothetical protein MIND_01066800 [Mycena indigotica]